jgi:hypothetical protein
VRYLALLLLFLAGACSAPDRSRRVVLLGEEFRPLVWVTDLPPLPRGLQPGMVATVGTTVYTLDLQALLEAYPEGSDDFKALMLHEREHSLNQQLYPLFDFWYQTQSTGFRWGEEKRGWKVELDYLEARGRMIDAKKCAEILSTRYGGMVSYPDALNWVLYGRKQ